MVAKRTTLILGLTIGGFASALSRADEVEWRAVGAPRAKPAPAVLAKVSPVSEESGPLLPTLDVPVPAATTAAADGARWRKVRAQAPSAPVPHPAPHQPTISPAYQPARDITLAPDYVGLNFGLGDPIIRPRGYVRAEALFWTMSADEAPPLASTGPVESFGFLDQPGTTVLFGGDDLPSPFRSGARFTAGCWLGPCEEIGLEVGGFFLGRRGFDYTADSQAMPTGVLSRPFFAPNLDREFAELVAFPGRAVGRLDIGGSTALWGAEANVKKRLCWGCERSTEIFAGFRYLDLNENLHFQETILLGPGSERFPQDTLVLVTDGFETHNQFYGGQIGANFEYASGRWFLDVTPKIAIGVTHQTVSIDGNQRLGLPSGGPPLIFAGGLLATPSNIGSFEADRFSVVPELTLTAGCYLTGNLRAFVGYNALYWSNVVRPGRQIDRIIDLTTVPNSFFPGDPTLPNRPGVFFTQSDLWVHGINFGMEYRW